MSNLTLPDFPLSSFLSFQVYLTQTISKLLLAVLILSYKVPYLSSLSFNHICHLEDDTFVGYATFECIHVLSSLMHKLLLAYLTLLGLFGLLNFYTLSWIFHRSELTASEWKYKDALFDYFCIQKGKIDILWYINCIFMHGVYTLRDSGVTWCTAFLHVRLCAKFKTCTCIKIFRLIKPCACIFLCTIPSHKI